MSTFQTLTPASLGREAFIDAFKDVYEHSPWLAEQAYDQARQQGALDTLNQVDALHRRMSEILLGSPHAAQLALINAHPDLAGKAAVRGELTEASSGEQAGAGIHQCSPEEFRRFTELNDTYKARFGFPFIMAVKGSDRRQILAAFETRIEHSAEAEFATALAEIKKIARFRLMTL
jgi:2-oxo-4-hydroxy-4-carboxy-5-ureidoimidazoline decarboxylase